MHPAPVVACAMEGTRPMLMEIQALVCKSSFGMPRRTAAGLDYNLRQPADGSIGKKGRIAAVQL